MIKLMENLLIGTFFLYLVSTVMFVVAVLGKRVRKGDEVEHTNRWGRLGIIFTMIGALIHVGFTVTRAVVGGYFPTSNMFEFISFFCLMMVISFIIIYFIYRTVALGALAMPVAVILLAYASVFPRDVQPLIPALQSYWLWIHVSVVALGQGALSIGFVAGLVYLIRKFGKERIGKHSLYLEIVLVFLVLVLGFALSATAFGAMGYQAEIQYTVNDSQQVQSYRMPPLVGPAGGQVVEMHNFLGMTKPLMEAPTWMEGKDAARKLNSVIWSIITGLLLYAIIRLLFRKRLHELVYPLVRSVDLETVDEIGYRAIAIGFPIFTLGGLIFGMIWAHEAWGRFWGWDPKEVWALITWLFYSAYLHLRLSRGWHGTKSAWMNVGGFVIIMINLIVVNLVFAGLHSYA